MSVRHILLLALAVAAEALRSVPPDLGQASAVAAYIVAPATLGILTAILFRSSGWRGPLLLLGVCLLLAQIIRGAPGLSSFFSQDEVGELELFGHSGSDGTYAWAWPERDLIILYFTQSRGGLTALKIEKPIDRLLIYPDEKIVEERIFVLVILIGLDQPLRRAPPDAVGAPQDAFGAEAVVQLAEQVTDWESVAEARDAASIMIRCSMIESLTDRPSMP